MAALKSCPGVGSLPCCDLSVQGLPSERLTTEAPLSPAVFPAVPWGSRWRLQPHTHASGAGPSVLHPDPISQRLPNGRQSRFWWVFGTLEDLGLWLALDLDMLGRAGSRCGPTESTKIRLYSPTMIRPVPRLSM